MIAWAPGQRWLSRTCNLCMIGQLLLFYATQEPQNNTSGLDLDKQISTPDHILTDGYVWCWSRFGLASMWTPDHHSDMSFLNI